MIQYEIFISNPHRHFITFRGIFPHPGNPQLELKLAAWRPGRYELGNFSKNIRAWKVTNEKNDPLPFFKSDKDSWIVACSDAERIVVTYEYYAAELNAGSTYLDETQLYINPVNCFFYSREFAHLSYQLQFHLPENFEIVSQLPAEKNHRLSAADFDHLADSPLIASPSLTHHAYRVDDVNFHIHAQGIWNLDTGRLLSDFHAFTALQVSLFGSIPCNPYSFLYQFPSYFLRHGVEHTSSTVIAMGPAAELGSEKFYNELLAISSHELFHTWNVKNIRPASMLPYDFSKENYSELGYIYEGVTTYYGDLMLMRSGVWNREKWLSVFSDEVRTHLENPGIFNHSVSDSSFDTWLDGYGTGIPWRKVSIYTEGCLAAFICDVMILRATNNRCSLDDVMRKMYNEFGQIQKGYTEADYIHCLESVSGISFRSFFQDVVHSATSYKYLLDSSLEHIGCTLRAVPSNRFSESMFGFGTDESNGKVLVTWIEPHGPADQAGLWIGDEIIAVNGVAAVRSFQPLLNSETGQAVELLVNKKMRLTSLKLVRSDEVVRWNYSVVRSSVTSDAQNKNWEYFCGVRTCISE